MNLEPYNQAHSLNHFLDDYRNQKVTIEHISEFHENLIHEHKVYYYGIVDNITHLLLDNKIFDFYPSNVPHVFSSIKNISKRISRIGEQIFSEDKSTPDVHGGLNGRTHVNKDNSKVNAYDVYPNETVSVWLKIEGYTTFKYCLRFRDKTENSTVVLHEFIDLTNEWQKFTFKVPFYGLWYMLDFRNGSGNESLKVGAALSYYDPIISHERQQSKVLFQGLKITIL